MPALTRAPVAATVSLALLLAPVRLAFADDASDAKDLFNKGRALYKQEKYLDACPLFEQSLQLDAALGTELNLALCWSKIGKLSDAAKLLGVISSKTNGAAEAQRHKIAQDALADIEGRMPKVQIERGKVAADAPVFIDGVEQSDISEPIPIDPGKHVVKARGGKAITVRAVEGETATVTLAVADEDGAGSGSDENPIDQPGGSSHAKLPYYVGGAGAGVVALSLITGIVTLKKKSSGLDMCDQGQEPVECTKAGQDKLDSARTWSHVTTALFVIGAAGVGAGVYLYLKKPKPDQPVVTGWATSSGGGLVVERAW
ncbi:MAG TPA: tetratricopeptide repeat protein [Kofleriaceae bacterium]